MFIFYCLFCGIIVNILGYFIVFGYNVWYIFFNSIMVYYEFVNNIKEVYKICSYFYI